MNQSSSQSRAHAPLRRVSRGAPLRVDPTLHVEVDSCYSSCSEETQSHSSLSRESSDALSAELNMALKLEDDLPEPVTPVGHRVPLEYIEFARNLGFTEAQLLSVIDVVGTDVGQDRILAELVKKSKEDATAAAASSVHRSEARRTESAPVNPGVVIPQMRAGAVTNELRPIVIDGSNLAMTHGRKEVFSCAGIGDCVKYFLERGHSDILVFIPQFRRECPRADSPIIDQHILADLDLKQHIVWTPSRRIAGRRIVCHDDRYILRTADEKDAVIVSNDEYRDLARENPQYRRLVESRLLMYSFVDGKFMPPDDPLGRHGPSLDQFLSKAAVGAAGGQPCPYGRKCTYGNKCKYYHPERPNGIHVSVTERLLKDRTTNRCTNSRPSASHSQVGRTQSLNVQYEGNNFSGQQQMLDPAAIQQQRQHAAVLEAQQHWHQSVSRIQSQPLPAQRQQNVQRTVTAPLNRFTQNSRSGSAADVLGHLFTPCQSIWGQSELSVGPIIPSRVGSSIPDFGPDSDRSHLQNLLCQLFPEPVVVAVMAAHPNESNPQALCERILAMRRGFQN